MRTIIGFGFLALMVLGCERKKNDDSVERNANEFPEAFQNGLDAHGGLSLWNGFGTLTFNEISGEDTISHLLDLKNRNERMEKKGEYKIGFTQDTVNIYPSVNSFPNKNPRFFHNLRFYFFAIPFVTADDGANQEEMPAGELNGVGYNRVKITFGDDVGIAPKDQYVLWYDQKTHLLKMINYSVTYFDESKSEQYNAIVFDQWKDFEGLKMPTEMIGYKWENDELGEERYRKYFDAIGFSRERPDPSVFVDLQD